MGSVGYSSVRLSSFELQLFSKEKNKYETVALVDYQGVKISKSCLKSSQMQCQAWGAVLKKVEKQAPPSRVAGNPAARYCLANNANNRILVDSQKHEFDYCVFSDGSMIDAWTLFNKHHK